MKKSGYLKPSISNLLMVTLSLMMLTKSEPISLGLNISNPVYNQNKIPLQFHVPNKNKSVTIGFPDINFEISSKIYTRGEELDQSVMYDTRLFEQSLSLNQYCDMYPTTIISSPMMRVKYSDNVENLKYTVFHNGGKFGSQFYMLGSNSKIYTYFFEKAGFVILDGIYEVQYSVSKIKDQELESNVQLVVIKGQLFLANKQGLYIFDEQSSAIKYFIKIEGYQPMEKLVDFGVAQNGPSENDLNGTKIWVCKQKSIAIYEIKGSGFNLSLTKVKQFSASMDSITAVVYDFEISSFHIIAGHTLSTIVSTTQKRHPEFSLQGICTHMTKIKSTLYLGCRYKRRDFIAEIRVENGGAFMVLNRFYDDSVIEGARDVEYLGFDKIAIIGDEQSLVISEAVNRNTLLDLSDKKTRQVSEYVFSFGMIDLFYLPQGSTPQHSEILVVGQNSISLHVLRYEAPQLQCNFHGQQSSIVSALVVFNISHCPFPNGDQYKASGTFTQCQVFYPLRIEFEKRQFEQKTANFIFIALMFILIVFVLLCAGFGAKIRNKANAMIDSMKTKIEKVRIAHQNSQMKKL